MRFEISEMFGRSNFKSYSEFYLALAIGKVFHENGHEVSFNGMSVDRDIIPKKMIVYYKWLLENGYIELDGFEQSGEKVEENDSNIDISYFKDIPLLYDIDKDTLGWDYDYAKNNYGLYKTRFLMLETLGYRLVHVVALHILKTLIGEYKKKLVLSFDSMKSKNTMLYVNLYAILKTVDWFGNLVKLDVDFSGLNVDIDYSIFCNSGMVAGHRRKYSYSEKCELLKKYGMVRGSILELWTRKGMNDNTPFGKIDGVSVVRVDEVGDDFISLTAISLNKTIEEKEDEYYSLKPEFRFMCSDMLENKTYLNSSEYSLCGMGIDNHMIDEDMFLTLLDTSENVVKKVTIDGNVAVVEMKEVDAIYWLLKQYNVEFDEELYENMYYTKGNIPLWEQYN